MIIDIPSSDFVPYHGEREERIRQYENVLSLARENGETQKVMRALAQRDLFFLLVYVLRVSVANKDWVFKMCREFEDDPTGHIDIWSREHFKSTIITLAYLIQRIINDCNITICIFSFNRPIAKSFLRLIKQHFETNELLKDLFPDVLYADPAKEATKWSEDDGIIVKRTEVLKEATIEAWGLVDGQPIGRHFKYLVYDDVVVPSSVSSAEMIEKTTYMMGLSFNLGSEIGNEKSVIGTRYHFADTYKTMIDRGALKLRVYPATHNGREDGVPWLFSPQRLKDKIIEMGPYVSACQLFCNPVMEGDEVFKPEWIERWVVKGWQNMNVYILVDPANGKTKKSDYSVFIVVGLASDNNYYVIDMVRDKLNLKERTQTLFDLHRKYRPKGVGYERYSMQADIQHIKEVMGIENYRFTITELGGNMVKNDRIKRLIPIFADHRMWLPDRLQKRNYEKKIVDVIEQFLQDEYYQFPMMSHDDMLDCLARITEVDMNVKFPKETKMDSPSWARKTEDYFENDTYAYIGGRRA